MIEHDMVNDIDFVKIIAEKVSQSGGRVFYVGGYVRDKLCGQLNKDIDIEVHGIDPDALRDILISLGTLDERKVGGDFGIMNIKGHDIDIALPRRERLVGDKHTDFDVGVDPHMGYEEAAKRRDFTINSLMEDVLTGEIIDNFGGCDDLKNGVIRCVDDKTYSEDALRVFRAAQFAARFGFEIDEHTISLSKDIDVSKLSRERISGELDKALLKSKKPSVFFGMLRKMDHLKEWFPEVEACIGCNQDPVHHPEGDVYTHTMMVLDEAAKYRDKVSDVRLFMVAALCHDFGKPVTTKFDEKKNKWTSYKHDVDGVPLVKKFCDRVYHEKDVFRYACHMTAYHMKPHAYFKNGSSDKSYMHFMDELKYPMDLLYLSKCDNDGRLLDNDFTPQWNKFMEELDKYNELMSMPQVRGQDLVDAGYHPSPVFTEAIAYAHKAHLSGVSKDEQMKMVRGEFGGRLSVTSLRTVRKDGIPCKEVKEPVDVSAPTSDFSKGD